MAQCPNCGGYKVYTETKQIETGGYEYWSGKKRFWTFALTLGLYGLPLLAPDVWRIIFAGKTPRRATVYHHACYLCGYRWTWQPGMPLPRVNVRPTLVAAGEQRLRAYNDRVAHVMAENALRQAGMR